GQQRDLQPVLRREHLDGVLGPGELLLAEEGRTTGERRDHGDLQRARAAEAGGALRGRGGRGDRRRHGERVGGGAGGGHGGASPAAGGGVGALHGRLLRGGPGDGDGGAGDARRGGEGAAARGGGSFTRAGPPPRGCR